MRKIFLIVFFFISYAVYSQEPAIIPKPVSTQWQEGHFTIAKNTILVADASEKPSADFFNSYLEKIYGLRLAVVRPQDERPSGNQPSSVIRLSTLSDPASAREGRYTMKVSPAGISITGDTHPGTFYGIQTLIQLLPVDPTATLVIPAVSVEDYPRFGYRGLHLDVGRHFLPVSFVKKYIDYIALHKMNYFHWHLTEDQGWRIEIKKYPKLTEIGSCRSGTIIGHNPGTGNDSTPHCGYYTQDEIRDVVKYAADRYITILPEIELPGHSSAALTAYPWLGCTGGPYMVQQHWGVFKDVFCAGNDSAFQFLEDVLDEVMALFPSKFIHIGGDECPKDSWENLPQMSEKDQGQWSEGRERTAELFCTADREIYQFQRPADDRLG